MSYIEFGPKSISPEATVGEIYVKPPLSFPDGNSARFIQAVLGQEGYGIQLQHAGVRDDATVFEASVAGHVDKQGVSRQQWRDEMFHVLAIRILRLDDIPEEASAMLDENPFPRPAL